MKCREQDSNLAHIVVYHTHEFLDETKTKLPGFVMDNLLPALQTHGCVVLDEPDCADGFEKLKSRKCKQIERMIKGDSPLPASFVMAWASALPEPYGKRCTIDMAACLGTVYTPLEIVGGPLPQPKSIRSRLDEISKEFADVLQVAEPAMDGRYDSTDSEEQLQRLADELYELHAATFNELGRIHRARGVMPRAHRMMANSPLFKEA